jgi:hypothetical protein
VSLNLEILSELTIPRWILDLGRQQCQSLNLNSQISIQRFEFWEPYLTICAFRAVARAEAALEAAEQDEVGHISPKLEKSIF